jgi:aspartyl-tRNA(Asn)/glutamyl-tRNA(Gln) amidotransferase subunit B
MTRHAARLDAGLNVVQETRHWHEDTGITTPGRSKEQAEDYRYFPEPDLVPIECTREWVDQLRATLPETPAQRRTRWQQAWGLTDMEIRDVVNAGAGTLIEATVAAGAAPSAARKWWMGELSRRAKADEVELGAVPVHPRQIGKLNDSLARQVLDGVLDGEGDPASVMAARGLELVADDGALAAAVDAAIAANPDVAEKVRDGKHQAVGALIGAVMKQMRGKADAAAARELLLARLTSPTAGH